MVPREVPRYAFPPLLDAIAGEYGVSEAALGGAFTAFMLVYAAMQFPSGIFGDRLGGVRVVTAGALVAVGGAVLVAVGDRLTPAIAAVPGVGPFWLVVLAMVVVGLGMGAHKTVAIGLLSRIHPARGGRVVGVHDTFGTLAGVAGPAAVAVALRTAGTGWRTIFTVAGALGVLLAAGFALRVPRRLPGAVDETAADRRRSIRAYAAPFRAPRFAAFAGVMFGFGFAFNGVVAFLPLYLVERAAVSEAVASGLYALLFGLSVVQVATGDLSDRVGRLAVVVGTVGVVALLGLGTHGFRPVRAAHLQDELPDAVAAGAFGAVRTGLMGAGAIAPAVVGVVAAVAGFRTAFAVLFATLAGSLAGAVGLWASDR